MQQGLTNFMNLPWIAKDASGGGGGGGGFTNTSSAVFVTASNSKLAATSSDNSFERTTAYSVSLWFLYPTSAGGCLFSKLTSGTTPGYDLFITGGVIYFEHIGSGSNYAIVQMNAPATGAWHHIVVTNSTAGDATGMKIYLNGSNTGQTTLNNTLGSSTIINAIAFKIGARNVDSTYAGNIDEFTVWNTALSSGNVTTLYNSGHPGDVSQVSFFANCTSWYRMGDASGDSTSTIKDTVGTIDLTATAITLSSSVP